jgi:glyoxylase-like metal-dependent hydrolase (beta-lactamase superfamily II)
MNRSMKFLRTLLVLLLSSNAWGAGLEVQKVSDRVYALVGETAQRSPDNLGNNATFGLVITDEGLVLIDPGGSEKGAAMLDAAIRTISTRPVVLVINTGGQDHRWLGNHYWKQRGARVIASTAAVEDQKRRRDQQLTALSLLVGDGGMEGTVPMYADQTFGETHRMEMGGVRFRLHHAGQAHTPGDIYVLLPDEETIFTGDIVYHDRLLGVGPQSNSKNWLEVFGEIEKLGPGKVVPGHGRAGSLEKSRRETGNYLRTLRTRVAEFLDQGGTLEEISRVDQSEFRFLAVFDQIAGRNAQQVFQEMEFDF